MRLARVELAQTFAQVIDWVDGVMEDTLRYHDEQKEPRVVGQHGTADFGTAN